MSRSQRIFGDFLEEIGALEDHRLGAERASTEKPCSQAQLEGLGGRLRRAEQSRETLLIILIVLLSLMFGLCLALALWAVSLDRLLDWQFGLAIAVLLGIVGSFRKIWIDQHRMQIVLLLLPELPPKDIVKVIQILYWSERSGTQERG